MRRLPYPVQGYKGIAHRNGKWIARTSKAGRSFYLGTYPTEHHAAHAVNVALAALYPGLPSRHLNTIPIDPVPAQQEAKDIRKEVHMRLRCRPHATCVEN